MANISHIAAPPPTLYSSLPSSSPRPLDVSALGDNYTKNRHPNLHLTLLHSFACVLSLSLPHSPPSRSLCLCLSLSRCDGLGVCFSSNNKLLKNLCTRVFGVVRCTNNNNNNSKHVSPANVVVALYDFYLLRFSCFCAKFFSFLSPRLVSSRLKLFSSLFFAR